MPSRSSFMNSAGCTLGLVTLLAVGLPTQAHAATLAQPGLSSPVDTSGQDLGDSSSDEGSQATPAPAPEPEGPETETPAPEPGTPEIETPEAPEAPALAPAPAPARPEAEATVSAPAPVAAPAPKADSAAPAAATPAAADDNTTNDVIPFVLENDPQSVTAKPGATVDFGGFGIRWGSFDMTANRITAMFDWNGGALSSSREVTSGGGRTSPCSLSGTTISCIAYNSATGGSGRFSNLYLELTVPADAQNGDVFTLTGTVTGNANDTGSLAIGPLDVTVGGAATTRQPTNVVADTSTKTVSGQGVPGSTITIVGPDGKPLESMEVPDSGQWSIPVPNAPAGTLSVTQTIGGVASAAVDTRLVTAAPVVSAHSIGDDGMATVSGTSEPFADIVLRDSEGNEIGSATADANGEWTATGVTVPGNGTAAAAASVGGIESVPTAVRLSTVSPTVTSATANADGTVSVSGTALPGADIVVTDADGNPIGTAHADDTTGAWSLDLTETPAGGALRVAQTIDGVTSPQTTTTVSIPAPVVVHVVSNADGSSTATGMGIPGSVITATDAAGNVVASAVVGEDGSWALDIPASAAGSTISIGQETAGVASASSSIAVPAAPQPQPGAGNSNAASGSASTAQRPQVADQAAQPTSTPGAIVIATPSAAPLVPVTTPELTMATDHQNVETHDSTDGSAIGSADSDDLAGSISRTDTADWNILSAGWAAALAGFGAIALIGLGWWFLLARRRRRKDDGDDAQRDVTASWPDGLPRA